jgi:hypothetical protein
MMAFISDGVCKNECPEHYLEDNSSATCVLAPCNLRNNTNSGNYFNPSNPSYPCLSDWYNIYLLFIIYLIHFFLLLFMLLKCFGN